MHFALCIIVLHQKDEKHISFFLSFPIAFFSLFLTFLMFCADNALNETALIPVQLFPVYTRKSEFRLGFLEYLCILCTNITKAAIVS